MSTKTYDEVRQQVSDNDPPVEVNQYWVALDNDGNVIRRIRILAPHPDGGWIFKDESMIRLDLGRMSITPEFNLRYVFELEQ
jgi:hypothetical protein